jgi:hypothetical protein
VVRRVCLNPGMFSPCRGFGASMSVDTCLSQAGTVPRSFVRCYRPNSVELKISDPQNLRRLGTTMDNRLLGIAVKSISLTPDNR